MARDTKNPNKAEETDAGGEMEEEIHPRRIGWEVRRIGIGWQERKK